MLIKLNANSHEIQREVALMKSIKNARAYVVADYFKATISKDVRLFETHQLATKFAVTTF